MVLWQVYGTMCFTSAVGSKCVRVGRVGRGVCSDVLKVFPGLSRQLTHMWGWSG